MTPTRINLAPVTLITGPEELLINRAIAQVVTGIKATEPGVQVLTISAAEYEPGMLASRLAPTLFAVASALVVLDIGNATTEASADVVAYLKDPDPQSYLVLQHSGGQRGKAVLVAAVAAGAQQITCSAITRDVERADFVAGEFAAAGVRASSAAIRMLVDVVGKDIRELAAAAAQIATDVTMIAAQQHISNEKLVVRIDEDHIQQWGGGRHEVTGFAVADAAVQGRVGMALTLARHALAAGVDPVPLVAVVATKLRAMAKVSAVRGNPGQVAQQTGLAPWQIDRARRELQGWTPSSLRAAIVAVAYADEQVKGGGRDAAYAVEHLIVTVGDLRSALN